MLAYINLINSAQMNLLVPIFDNIAYDLMSHSFNLGNYRRRLMLISMEALRKSCKILFYTRFWNTNVEVVRDE